MQKPTQSKALSESYTDAQQQQKKQLVTLLFPMNQVQDELILNKLNENLKQNFNESEHYQHLINNAFRNHNSGHSKVYRQFFKLKFGIIQEPKISFFYQNQCFPDLQFLGQYRSNPINYPKKIIGTLQQSLFTQLDKIFFQFGYIPHMERYLTFFPKFLYKIRIVQKELFEKSKIDQQTTYFIGLCAASQMGCPYMINRMTIKYLSKGGKIDWIQKKKYPSRIEPFLQLNRKIARCIWQLTSQDFQEIIENSTWNLNEVALIVQIMSYIHLLCTITLGLGLIPQQRNLIINSQKIQAILKQYRQEEIQSGEKSKKQSLKQVLPNLKSLIQQIKNTPTSSFIQTKINPKKSFRKQRKNSDEDQNIQIQPYMKQIGNQLTQQKLVKQVLNQMSFLLPKFNSIQKRRDNKNNQFTCVDFNFEFKAFPRLQNITFVTESTIKILALIKQGEQMGLQNFGSQMIGTTKQLRKAQRYYAENLCGFSHPQYDYKKFMTNILTMPLKFYIRLLMLSPLHMKRQILDEINHQKGQIQLFDLGHTAILIAIARFKLTLTLTTYYFDY